MLVKKMESKKSGEKIGFAKKQKLCYAKQGTNFEKICVEGHNSTLVNSDVRSIVVSNQESNVERI